MLIPALMEIKFMFIPALMEIKFMFIPALMEIKVTDLDFSSYTFTSEFLKVCYTVTGKICMTF